ncbi:filamentous hemagglutinin N-terminal domain-containing protein [Pseudanabaena sp. UWO311]|uniref:two-partner secretion domain-containing protein n=1 Tax=Pseudanabaena sp. UWO311 TaxID=2487337 RepID=UPI00115B9F08|nr:filamentous hemagglutinin N-terminal domain-containing protein [Pseudanabaena sp. UWO311]TYQ27977.1 filamentous hemagglutinin N-terminal domain-containing protein [Pseudanabaena sp. UWO311]
MKILRQNSLRNAIAAFMLANMSALCIPQHTFAQITPDATLPSPSVVVDTNPLFTITGGTTANTNLFHSFSQFSLLTGSEAFFDNLPAIQNILVRVTGNSISSIDGLIRANDTANLFLINPNGIIFGQNASLIIGGSFLATTANSVQFLDGSEFRANANTQTTSPLLLVSAPVGLQFNGLTNGAIAAQGSPLSVLTGKTLALVGGDITLQGAYLYAESGRIELGSIAGNGYVAIAQTGNGLSLNYDNAPSLGNIRLDQESVANTSGLNGGGNIQVQGRQVTLEGGSELQSSTFGNGNGGDVFVRATELFAINRDSNTLTSSIGTDSNSSGKGGNIIITTDKLLINENVVLSSASTSSGNAGSIDITAKNIDLIINKQNINNPFFPIFIGVLAYDTGNGGNLKITTDNLRMTGGSVLAASTVGIGNAGTIDITAKSIFLDGSNSRFPSAIFSESVGTGNGGNVRITADSILLKNGGQILVDTQDNGNAGNLSINSKLIDISGQNDNNRSGLFANATFGAGNGGNIQVNSDRLIVRDGGIISASNFNTSLTVPDPSNVGSGSVGNITINSPSILLDQGSINVDSLSGSRGNINLNSNLILLRNGSTISANAFGTATGGNITINTALLVAIPTENSDITATSINNFGGRVIIADRGVVIGFQFVDQLTPLSDITASSSLGSQFNGLVSGRTSDKLIADNDLADRNKPQIVAACDRFRDNEFIVTGRGGVPSDATQVISSQAIWRDLRLSEIPSTQSNSTSQTETNLVTTQSTRPVAIQPIPKIEAQGWEKDRNGNLKLLAYATSPSAPVWRLPVICSANSPK